MKFFLTKIHALSFLCALPALANDGFHNSSAQHTRADSIDFEIADIQSISQNQQKFDYLLKACQEMPSGSSVGSAASGVYPGVILSMYLKEHYNRDVDDRLILEKLIEKPVHGELKYVYHETMQRSFLEYHPSTKDYEGKDKAVYLLELDGKRYKLVLNFIVTPSGDLSDAGGTNHCPPDTLIKLGSLSVLPTNYAEMFPVADSVRVAWVSEA